MEEYEMLSESEKATSIRSKIKNIQYQRYSLELDLIAENAIPNPNETSIENIESQIANLDARQNALKSELELLI